MTDFSAPWACSSLAFYVLESANSLENLGLIQTTTLSPPTRRYSLPRSFTHDHDGFGLSWTSEDTPPSCWQAFIHTPLDDSSSKPLLHKALCCRSNSSSSQPPSNDPRHHRKVTVRVRSRVQCRPSPLIEVQPSTSRVCQRN
jgi:hypothetical protein